MLQESLTIAEQLRSPSVTYPLAYALGQWYEGQGSEQEAAELYGKAKVSVEQMVTAVDDETLRSVFLRSEAVQAISEALARIH